MTTNDDAEKAPSSGCHDDVLPIEPTLIEKANALAAKVLAQPKKRRVSKKLTPRAFENTQLSLFQNFLVNSDDERSQLANTFDLWDSIPRYSVSRQTMNKMRSAEGGLKLLKHDFHYRTKKYRAVISPAKIELPNADGELVEMDFYPSANEELVEDALRKIATDQQQGFFDKDDYRSGVTFSLHALREELKRRGHTRSFQEITMSLRIMAKSNIEIIDISGNGEGIALSNYLPALAGVTRADLNADPNSKWVAQFHPLVTRSIDEVTYRQFNYHKMMSHDAQLARWLHRQIVLKFTFAAIGRTFVMKFSTIKRDSAMFTGYAEGSTRLAVKALDDAFAELMPHVILLLDKKVIRGDRSKILDVEYSLSPSHEFVKAVKAANKRVTLAEERLGLDRPQAATNR